MTERKAAFFLKPQINLSCPSNRRMWLVCGCAFLCVLQSALSDGGKSLIIAFTSLVTAVLIEFLLTRKKSGCAKIIDGSSAATALIFSMMLPNQIHPIYAALGAAFAIVVVKYSFGGLGSNWLNPALGGWLFVRFSWPSAYANGFGSYMIDSSSASITEMIATSDISPLDVSVTEFLNNTVFSVTGSQMPSGYVDLLFNNNPGMIIDRGLFALLIGTIIITSVGINRGWIPVVFLSVYAFFVRLAGDVSGVFWNGDMLYGIFSGGTIAAAFILAAEPSSSAKLKPGILFSVILAAVLSWFFRYRCLEYSGVFIALALVNCLTPVIRLIEDKIFFSKGKHGFNKKDITNGGFQENLL